MHANHTHSPVSCLMVASVSSVVLSICSLVIGVLGTLSVFACYTFWHRKKLTQKGEEYKVHVQVWCVLVHLLSSVHVCACTIAGRSDGVVALETNDAYGTLCNVVPKGSNDGP